MSSSLQQSSLLVLPEHNNQWKNRPTARFMSNIPPNSINDNDDNDDYLLSATDMEFYDSLSDDYYSSLEDSNREAEEEEERDAARRQAIRDEIDSRKGRLWEDPWEVTDEDWSSGKTYFDLPDWTEEICSRVSLERVKVHPDGIPTLDVLATLKFQPSDPSHPALGNPQPYLKHRKQKMNDSIYKAVVEIAKPQMEKILSMQDWNDKQDAIDDLYVHVHDKILARKEDAGDVSDDTAKEDENEYLSVVLGSQPNFQKMVERALEKYLKQVVQDEKTKVNDNDDNDKENKVEAFEDPNKNDIVFEPIFMDLLKGQKSEVDENEVPKIIAPMKPHAKDGPGRMIEEWELSSKRDTKRIMCRECISDIAASMLEAGSRVFVHGREGAGKTAALTSIVASARASGNIVLYLPDGHRLSRHGFYVEPNAHFKANGKPMYDLPILTNEVCSQLLESHEKDFDGMIVSGEVLGEYLSSDQLKKLRKELNTENEDGEYNLVDILKVGSENVSIGAGCYGAIIKTLMNQEEKSFTVIMDEFNSYFDNGHYFHEDYDPNVINSIPLTKITLFQPFLDAVGVERQDDGSIITKEAVPMKKGSIVVGVTESHAIKRDFTAALEAAVESAGCKMVKVPQFSHLEVEHILANFEIIGIGRLRFDRGATVMNSQEVAYLRMVSGGIGQKLLDACVH